MDIQEAQTWDTPVYLCKILEQFWLPPQQWVVLEYFCAAYCLCYLQRTEQKQFAALKICWKKFRKAD